MKMSNEVEENINLKDIMDISEEEFKKQISAWIDDRGISRKLQSKLRADLFEQFNRTKLGRQMTEQHQQAHRIVLSPLILVLNTLIAEFLYTEDCHFTLSVFTNEVPYKNTLPYFEATPSRQLFQFSHSELSDIFEAVGISKQNEEIVREFYLNRSSSSSSETMNKSLLYCIIKTLITQIDSARSEKSHAKSNSKTKTKTKTKAKVAKVKPSTSTTAAPSISSQQSSEHKHSSYSRPKYEHFHISSRYFKYLNRYLDILSDRINDMAKSLAEQHSNKKTKQHTVDSSNQEESLKKDLRKIVENINKLSKSQRKSQRFQSVLNSIERLSVSVEKCNGKLGDLLNAIDTQTKNPETNEKKSNETKVDRLSSMDYAAWLRELKTSENGRKFIDRLEESLQKTMEKERENLEKLYEEKTNNYRMLIRLHYKQKYEMNKSEPESVERREKDDSSPVDKFTPDLTEKLMNESLTARALEKEQQVAQIVQAAKQRLQQLERESEDLDQSFRTYLRRQKFSKQQLNDDASKIWENYNLSKAALAKYDMIEDKLTNTAAYHSKLADAIKMNRVMNSTFHDDVDIEEVLKDLNEIKQLQSPRFNKNEAFTTKNILLLKSQESRMNTRMDCRPKIDYKQMILNSQHKPASTKKAIIRFSQQSQSIISSQNEEQREIVMKNVESNNNEKPNAKENENEMPKEQFIVKPSLSDSNETSTPVLVSAPVTIPVPSLSETDKISNPKGFASTSTNGQITEIKTNEKKRIDIFGPSALVNGQNSQNEQSNENKQGTARIGSATKINGFDHFIEELKANGISKVPEMTVENGYKKSSAMTSNGHSSKLATFTSIASGSDSNDADSEQISIGVQQMVNQPTDDFWI